jgi:mRNA-degrading endonuclease toxin of MazEF toxin-antitoxin module
VIAGAVVTVDWRDALYGSSEPKKRRPGIVVGSPRFFGRGLPFEMVVPLSAASAMAIPGGVVSIEPTPENGCTKRSFALAWNVQSVPHARITETSSRITTEQLADIRRIIALWLGV